MALLHSSMVPLGTPAHDFSCLGIDGKQYGLSSFAQADVLVVVFMCNHCPYVQAMWDDLVALAKAMPKEVAFVGINSNANPKYPEDSYEKMKEYAEARGQKFPYLYDEKQEVARAYDAQCTPDIFVYDADRFLAYRGAFAGLEPAIQALLKKEPVPEAPASMGCSIKWN